MKRPYVTRTKADKQPVPLPKEVEPIGPRRYRNPVTGDEYEVLWNGDVRDGYLTALAFHSTRAVRWRR